MVAAGAVAVDLLTVGAAVVALWYGGLLFVDAAAVVARRVGISELVVGLTVVAIGTSLPEFAVTVDAAIVGRADIAVANVVGSNLLNLGLVLGSVAVLGTVAASRTLVYRDGMVMLASSCLCTLVAWDLSVSRAEGALLLVAFLGYLSLVLLKEAQSDTEAMTQHASRWTALRLLVGFVLIVGGANLLVSGAADLARVVGLSEWVIGETVVALGTSMPEMVASLAAARRGLGDIAAGNLVGSSVFNALGVLGLAGVLVPLQIAPDATLGLLWLVGTSVAVVAFLWSGARLDRPEGAVLVVATLSKLIYDLIG